MGSLRRETLHVLNLAHIWAARTGETVWVTSWNDHVHRENSLHYRDLAIDLDTSAQLWDLYVFLRSRLPQPWQIFHEQNHVHSEWDND